MMKKYVFLLITLVLFSCDDDENIPGYMQNPPIGNTYSNELLMLTFESADSLSYYLVDFPEERDTVFYQFKNGVVIVDSRKQKSDFSKVNRPILSYMHAFFESPDKFDADIILSAQKNESGYGYIMQGKKSFFKIVEKQ